MYNLLKKLLKHGEPTLTVISFDAIPAMLAERDTAARDAFISQTKVPVHNIRNAIAQLQHIVNGIAGAEHDPAIHPKLKSIAKNSLPLFVKAMNASLSKELPEDVEEFYVAAVDCVKGSLNASRGQGRYLQVVFPEEMKNVRTGIDAIGREINQITGTLTEFRKKKEGIDTVRKLFDAVHDIREDFSKSAGKDKRIESRIREITERIASIESEINLIALDEGMKTVQDLRSNLAAIEKDRDESARVYAALSMTASHVFRKAEKIAAKKHMNAEISILKHSMELLSDHTPPDIQSLAGALAAACPIAERMIADGEIILKNKEERAIFSDSSHYSRDLCSRCREIGTLQTRFMEAETTLSSHPLLLRSNSLSREKTQLELMLTKEQHSRQELEEWTARTKERIPVLIQELGKKIEGMIGGSVQLQIDTELLS